MNHQKATLPTKAEYNERDPKEGGHSVADQRAGMSGAEVEAKPERGTKGKHLTRQEIDLQKVIFPALTLWTV